MRPRWSWLVLLALALWPRLAHAEGDLSSLLSREASVTVEEELAAWTALALPAEVLEQTRPDLSDLRLFDERGVEVPHLILGGGDEPWPVMLDRTSFEVESERSHLVVSRPPGLALRRLVVRTTTPAFDRRIEVRDFGVGGGGRLLATAQLRRDPGEHEPLTIALEEARGEALELVVADGDSPPLENLVVLAEVARPVLLSALDGPGQLRFGGGRLRAPRYDLPRDAARRALGHRSTFEARPSLRWADVGDARDNPGFDPLPALAFAMKPGAPVALEKFRHRRPVTVPASREGLSELPLSVGDRAHARPDLGDLRVVDDRGHQLPFLIEATGRRLRSPLTIEPPVVKEGGNTRHGLGLPGPRVPVSAVELVLSSTFADRAYRLVAGEGAAAITIAAGYLRRRPGEGAALRVELGETEAVSTLALEVEDGDDAPLAIVSATVLVPAAALFVAAPEGRYWLMSGAPDLAPPQYELERARPMLLSLSRERARSGPLEDNPAFVPAPSDRPPPILWAVLGLAVAVLGWLTLRAVAEDEPDDEGPNPGARKNRVDPLNA